ncbi:MAG TPA: CehA/McbA family metallohydrolase [Verrucomicrobiae bacterium]|nr:CehA/McbA family metallohydrolase [Verrucomicrobiae bacterium]
MRILMFCGFGMVAMGQTNGPLSSYNIYAGNTHSHTMYTWSHGDQWVSKKKSGEGKEPILYDTPEGVQYPATNATLKPDWRKAQGPPSAHFALAKSNGYDFYITTDHSQEAGFNPVSATNAEWMDTKRAAAEATDDSFVALAGYEHSENNGPGGVGHLNVINSAEYLNALAPGIDLPYLYKWLETARPNGDGPVVVSFNHPGPHQYHDWDYRDSGITDIITMLEVINSNNKIHYAGFINALDKGWKVSPVCGNDNHGLWGITHHRSRTFVLAGSRTKAAILDAMKNRRTYASLDQNIQCRYSVNGAIMGSTLNRPEIFRFDIAIDDPDKGNPNDKITKVDIVKDGGAEVESYSPSPDYSVHWQPVVDDSTNRYFFVRVWNASGGDAPGADPAKPIAWLAPVWTGR